jgi:hypothetical protein
VAGGAAAALGNGTRSLSRGQATTARLGTFLFEVPGQTLAALQIAQPAAGRDRLVSARVHGD